MTENKPTRRELMRPAQLLGLALGAAVFGGLVTLVAMGFFQQRGGDQMQHSIVVALIVTGSIFIVTLVVMSLLLLAVDPAQVAKTIDHPVLRPEDAPAQPDEPDAASGDTPTAP